MKISHQSVLSKLELEIQQARLASTDERVKKHLYTMKTLCEIILEGEPEAKVDTVEFLPAEKTRYLPAAVQQPGLSDSFKQEKKLITEDGANGESIFDF